MSGPTSGLPTYETLLVDSEVIGVLLITLNRPKQLNAINSKMSSELYDLLRRLREDHHPDVKVVVFTGAGDGFCSGADLSPDARAERPHSLVVMRRTTDLALMLHALPQATVAKVNGIAAGAGCNLAFSCDFIIASESARFSEIFSRRGLSLDFGGSWLLPRMTGIHRAKEIAFFGDVLTAQVAQEFGIVNRVVEAGRLDDFVAGWTRKLSDLPLTALAQTKALLNSSVGPSMSLALEEEGTSQALNFGTADSAEAIAAWIEKRPAKFRGE